jgi:hypothetical protein
MGIHIPSFAASFNMKKLITESSNTDFFIILDFIDISKFKSSKEVEKNAVQMTFDNKMKFRTKKMG